MLIRLKIKGYELYFKRVEVLHYYPDTALKVFKRVFKRGEWNGRIRRAYKSHKGIFQMTSKLNNLRYFIGLGLGLLSLNKNFKYDLITGVAWRIGLLYGYRFRKKIILI